MIRIKSTSPANPWEDCLNSKRSLFGRRASRQSDCCLNFVEDESFAIRAVFGELPDEVRDKVRGECGKATGAGLLARFLSLPRSVFKPAVACAGGAFRLGSARMLALEKKPTTTGTASRPLPPLENGESMHSLEFLRRFEGMPQTKKAELIEGVVYMGSPVSVRHAQPDALVQGWLLAYAARHPSCQALANVTVILDAENTAQPDAVLRRLPRFGGATRETEDGYLAATPELIVEIAVSSGSIDLRDKRRAYCRNGVPEYLVWRVTENLFDWFHLVGDEYQAQVPDLQGFLKSRGFPGLRLPLADLLAFDATQVLAALEPIPPGA